MNNLIHRSYFLNEDLYPFSDTYLHAPRSVAMDTAFDICYFSFSKRKRGKRRGIHCCSVLEWNKQKKNSLKKPSSISINFKNQDKFFYG